METKRSNNWIYGLALTCALVLFTVGYFEAVRALPSVVRPHSTAGLIVLVEYFFAFLAGIFGFIAGFVAGRIIDSKAKKRQLTQPVFKVKNKVCFILICAGFVVALILFLNAKIKQDKFNAIHKIEESGVKYDSGVIEKIKINKDSVENYDFALNNNHVIRRPGRMNFESRKDLVWKEKKYTIMFSDSSLIVVKSDDSSIYIDYSLKKYIEVSDKILSSISYLVFENSKGSFLFTLTHLQRPPSLYVLSVFSEDGTNVYEELTGRMTHIEFGEINGEKVVVTGNEITENAIRVVKVRDFVYKLKD